VGGAQSKTRSVCFFHVFECIKGEKGTSERNSNSQNSTAGVSDIINNTWVAQLQLR
jgi:hypothetical protein